MTALEIMSLDLHGTQLAVLSACETALAKKGDIGEEFRGLRHAFAIAGALSQVVSLWKVDDDATQFLMKEYYGLLAEGRLRPEALQLAQQKTANQPLWKHPFFWAAFIPSGEWRSMEQYISKRH